MIAGYLYGVHAIDWVCLALAYLMLYVCCVDWGTK